jgi:hypothetical protein
MVNRASGNVEQIIMDVVTVVPLHFDQSFLVNDESSSCRE